jgi:hypothetical protein
MTQSYRGLRPGQGQPAAINYKRRIVDVKLLLAYTRGKAKKEKKKESDNVYNIDAFIRGIKRIRNSSSQPNISHIKKISALLGFFYLRLPLLPT